MHSTRKKGEQLQCHAIICSSIWGSQQVILYRYRCTALEAHTDSMVPGQLYISTYVLIFRPHSSAACLSRQGKEFVLHKLYMVALLTWCCHPAPRAWMDQQRLQLLVPERHACCTQVRKYQLLQGQSKHSNISTMLLSQSPTNVNSANMLKVTLCMCGPVKVCRSCTCNLAV